MEFKSILSRKGNLSYKTSEPPFFKDLRLDSLLNMIRREVQGYSVRDFFYTFPGDPADISYRQEIFGELAAREGLVSSFREFCSLMQASREYKQLSEEAQDGLRRAGYPAGSMGVPVDHRHGAHPESLL